MAMGLVQEIHDRIVAAEAEVGKVIEAGEGDAVKVVSVLRKDIMELVGRIPGIEAHAGADAVPAAAGAAELQPDEAKTGQSAPEPDPVPVAVQKEAGVPPEETVTIAEQKAGTPPPPAVQSSPPGPPESSVVAHDQ